MTTTTNLIAFGTFGNPNGFRQTFFSGKKELAAVIKTFDLNTNAIKLVPDSRIYAIRKEHTNGSNAISYAVYTFAKEQNSERAGTFIGSALLYTNEIAEESLTIRFLNEFHQNLVARNVQNDIIMVNHSDDFVVVKPNDFDKISFNLKSIENVSFTQFSGKSLVIYAEIKSDKIKVLLHKSLDLLNIYDTIYFTDNNEIAEFVHHKGIFKLSKVDGFEQELINQQNERKQRLNRAITDFEEEKHKLNNDRSAVVTKLEQEIATCETTHFENNEIITGSKRNAQKIVSFYNEFTGKVDEYIAQLKSGKKPEQVKELYNANKEILINSIRDLQKPVYIKKLAKIETNSSLQIEKDVRPIISVDSSGPAHNINRRKRRRFNYYKISTFFLSLLWVSTIACFIWIYRKQESEIQQAKIVKVEAPVIDIKNTEPVPLPVPNSALTGNDIQSVIKQGLKGKPVTEIVDIIFKQNRKDIGTYYTYQKEIYGEYLISKNKNCFQGQLCINDSLKIIPSYLKQEIDSLQK